MSEMDLRALRDAAKADARARRAIESADEVRHKLAPPVSLLTQTVLGLIDALRRKGVLDSADLQEEVARLRQIEAALAADAKNPLDFS